MSDPYSILGVDRNATDEDVKKAYRKLSRQYHPDANINNPKKDQAEAKFKEVQQAYQQIMDEREKEYNSGYGSSDGSGYGSYGPFGGFGGFGSYGYGSAGSTGGTSGMSEEDAHLNAAANYIRSGHYKEALNVLAGISQHSARWYFYSASANSGLGNNVTALVWNHRICSIRCCFNSWKVAETGIRQGRQCTDIREPTIVAGV